MSATTSDAMLRTRFVCYLYSFSLPFFFFDADDGYTALQTNGRRMIFYLRHTREELLICIYVCVLPCSDDDATEMKRVLRRGGTLQWDVREEREREGGKKPKKKNINIYALLSHQSSDVFILFCSPLIGAHEAALRKREEKKRETKKWSCSSSISFILSLSLSHLLSAIVFFSSIYTRAWLSSPLLCTFYMCCFWWVTSLRV
jgi:hypothetical protein